MISFKPLQKTLIDKDMTKTQLTKLMQMSTSTAAKLWNNEYVALKIVDDICNKLECKLTDVMEHIPDEEKRQDHKKE